MGFLVLLVCIGIFILYCLWDEAQRDKRRKEKKFKSWMRKIDKSRSAVLVDHGGHGKTFFGFELDPYFVRGKILEKPLQEGYTRLVERFKRYYPLISFGFLSTEEFLSRPAVIPDYQKLTPEQLLWRFLSIVRDQAVAAYLKNSPDFSKHGPAPHDGVAKSFWKNEGRNRQTLPGIFPPDWTERRLVVYQRDAGRCRYCGINIPLSRCHIHHLERKSKTGDHSLENLVTLCKSCHSLMPDHVEPMKWYKSHYKTRNYKRVRVRVTKKREIQNWGQSLLRSVVKSVSAKYSLSSVQVIEDFRRSCEAIQCQMELSHHKK
ncbi:MAG: HNH endonuclease [Desulfomonilaceae bacterium]